MTFMVNFYLLSKYYYFYHFYLAKKKKKTFQHMLGQIEKIKNYFKLYVNELLLIFFSFP